MMNVKFAFALGIHKEIAAPSKTLNPYLYVFVFFLTAGFLSAGMFSRLNVFNICLCFTLH